MLSFGLWIKWCISVKEFTQLLRRLLKFGFIANIGTLYSSTTILILK